MKPPPTLMGAVFGGGWFAHRARRRLVFVLAAAILAGLGVWPQRWLARADLQPQDSSGGLSALLGQGGGAGLGGLGALLGNRDTIEADLVTARSQAVADAVITRLRLAGRPGFADARQARLSLRRRVDIAAIRGGIIQISARDTDPAFAQRIVAAFVEAIQARRGSLSLTRAAQRRAVAENRLAQASARLAAAQAALARFRAENRLAAPEAQLGAGVSQLAGLQANLQARQVELQTLRQFATGANVRVQAVQAQIAGLEGQIAKAQTASRGQDGPSLAAMALQSARYLDLFRDEKFAEALYGVYTRFLEQVTVDELSAGANMDLVEPPYVDPARQFNLWAVGLLVLLVVVALAAEVYVADPPPGARRGPPDSGR